MVLVRPVGTILPDAVAIMSTWPKTAQITAIRKNRMIVAPMARLTGEAGVSTISSAAGRNCRAVSSRRRRSLTTLGRLSLSPFLSPSLGKASTDDMQPRLQLMEGGIAPGPCHQFVVAAILYQPAALDVDDPVGMAHRG